MAASDLNQLNLPATPEWQGFFRELWPLYAKVNQITRYLQTGGSSSLASTPAYTLVGPVNSIQPLPSWMVGLSGGLPPGTPIFQDESANLLTDPAGVSGVYYAGVVIANGTSFLYTPSSTSVTQ